MPAFHTELSIDAGDESNGLVEGAAVLTYLPSRNS